MHSSRPAPVHWRRRLALRAARLARFAAVGGASLVGPGCDLVPAKGDEMAFELIGCLSAGGASTEAFPPVVPSIVPWLAAFPGLGQTIDAQLSGIAAHTAATFAISPSIRYYDDGRAPNAFASSYRTEGRPDGSVRLGVNLVASEVRRFVTTEQNAQRQYSYSVTAILAHELAHIVQVKQGMASPGKATELQADFLAGWYLSVLAQTDPNFRLSSGLEDGIRAFYSRGDYDFNSPHHHGTHDERAAAFLAGFRTGAPSIASAWTASVAFRSGLRG